MEATLFGGGIAGPRNGGFGGCVDVGGGIEVAIGGFSCILFVVELMKCDLLSSICRSIRARSQSGGKMGRP